MRKIELPCDDWIAFFAEPGAKALPYMLEHADHFERLAEQHEPEETLVRLGLTDGIILRSYNRARWQLSIPCHRTEHQLFRTKISLRLWSMPATFPAG